MMVSTRISTLAVAAALLAACGGSQASSDPTSMPTDGADLVTREMAPLTALESPPPPGDPAADLAEPLRRLMAGFALQHEIEWHAT